MKRPTSTMHHMRATGAHHWAWPAAGILILALSLPAQAREKTEGKRQRPAAVWTWHDRAVDFAALAVFDTEPLPPGTANRIARGIKTEEDEIREALIAAFEARGYRYGPDADRIDAILTFVFTPPENRRGGSGGRIARGVQTTLEGDFSRSTDNQLYVELRHPESGMPIWRGRLRKVLRKKVDDLTSLRSAARQIADAFPPSPARAPAEQAHDGDGR